MQFKKSLLAIPFIVLAMQGCNNDVVPGSSTLNIAVTDAPVDAASAVWVEFTGVELKPNGGPSISMDFDAPKKINLLALQGRDFEFLLNNQSINPGIYNWMRLKVNAERDTLDSYVVLENGGGSHSLYIPSGSETGLKLNSTFTVIGGNTHNLTIDFDLRKSVHLPEGIHTDYVLRPSLRLVQDRFAGHITGEIHDSLINIAGCKNAVYLYEGATTPDDVGGSGSNPMSTSLISLNNDTGAYEYAIGFLDEGNYTVAYTCKADDDDPNTDDAITFLSTALVTIEAKQTTEYNFPEYIAEE